MTRRSSAARSGCAATRSTSRCDWASGLLADPAVEDDILDAFMQFETLQSAEPFEVRVGKTKFWARFLTRAGEGKNGRRGRLAHAVLHLQGEANVVPPQRFRAGDDGLPAPLGAPAAPDAPAHRGRPIWLVGEMPYKAQDTGLAFFRYLRSNHPEIDAYYVIDPESPEMRNVAAARQRAALPVQRAHPGDPACRPGLQQPPPGPPVSGAHQAFSPLRAGDEDLPAARGDGHQVDGAQLRQVAWRPSRPTSSS